MKRKRNVREYMLFVVAILFISLIVNVFISIDNNKYKYKVSKVSCKNIEEIKFRNEKNIVTLENSINSNILTNENLLILYKNYTSISNSMVNLWDEYSFYNENEWSIFRKNIDTTKALSNEVSGRIKDYLALLLDGEMRTQSRAIVLDGETLEKFKTMLMLANDINNYYNDFYKENLDSASYEEREKEIIKNVYWVDMLEGLNNITGEYSDYSFSI